MSDVKEPPAITLDSALDNAMKEALSSVERREQAAKAAPAEVEMEISSVPVPVDAPPPSGTDVPVALEVEVPAAVATPAPPPKRGPQDAIIEALIRGKQETMEALKQTQKEAKDLLDARVRMQAEFENYKKRINRDKQDAAHALTQKIMRDVLPVADNLERALSSVDEATANLTPEMKSLLTGIKMVGKQMAEALRKVGVAPFSAKGEPFDPARHEAVSQVPATGDVTPGTVVEEHQRGYLLGEQLLRPALVVVAGPRE
jgi:molecular chaperone GrpE